MWHMRALAQKPAGQPHVCKTRDAGGKVGVRAERLHGEGRRSPSLPRAKVEVVPIGVSSTPPAQEGFFALAVDERPISVPGKLGCFV